MRQTVVAVNAHPDDEAILTGGTLAALAASGHRVVLVTLTRGEAHGATTHRSGAGAAGEESAAAHERGALRMAELRASARALGAADVIDLGYADSGMGPEELAPVGQRERLHTVPVARAAARLAAVLREQNADVVLGYDAAGGYGHRDHLSVHHITRAALADAGGPRLLEATLPREAVLRVARAGFRLRTLPGLRGRFAPGFTPEQWTASFTPSAQITHRVDVRPFVAVKRAALRAHVTQTRSADGGVSTMATVLGLPPALSRLLLGREYFVEPARKAASPAGRDALRDLVAGPR